MPTGKRIKADAAAREALHRLAKKDSRLYRERVVQEARKKGSALHRYFEWDDGKAAAQFRLQQAGELIRIVVDVRDNAREWVSLRCDQTAEDHVGGYRPMTEVLNGPALRAAYEQTALGRLRALQKEFEVLSVFVAELEAAATRLMAQGFGIASTGRRAA